MFQQTLDHDPVVMPQIRLSRTAYKPYTVDPITIYDNICCV